MVWTDEDSESDLGEELWGAGFFLGLYPVQGRNGVFLGGPTTDLANGRGRFVADLRAKLTTINARMERALQAVLDDPDPYLWPLADCRTPTWSTGRTILLGDAAAGFLPTAGIGAGMAIESAWVLARMLRQAPPEAIPETLQAYEKAQRPRVEAAQTNSRRLAQMMFHRSRALAIVRDLAMRIVSVKAALKPIQRLLANPPEPAATTRHQACQ